MTDIDIMILEARMNAILEAKIPIYRVSTPERRRDCWSVVSVKNHQRQVLRMQMVRDANLIEQLEKEIEQQ